MSVKVNPFSGLIDDNHDIASLQSVYEKHRCTRSSQQVVLFLSPKFIGMSVDPVLRDLETAGPGIDPALIDTRRSLVIWARPSDEYRDLICSIQARLQAFAPHLWVMPRDKLHATILEIVHSSPDDVVAQVLEQVRPKLTEILALPQRGRVVLGRPMLCFDASALALTVVPIEASSGDLYTYHHLRRDCWDLVNASGVHVASRYIVPSAHFTVARFVTTADFERDGGGLDTAKATAWVDLIGGINKDLSSFSGIWVVGEDEGLICRFGRVWYGDGESAASGTPLRDLSILSCNK
ncbi:hypothetical protein FISHEDRAFT_65860 [Fistulina hepatica ATCC 64428]|uniref:Uncharacterized protein n=1 Tax=Fistulina hepatica ATCC 64428 TaxID=1128425 RepID=A0A0D7AAU7_9AGAR|nr:hypothetical protein FISHEDRAFT_65860 [Fistulina hepatica ATCC 64428]